MLIKPLGLLLPPTGLCQQLLMRLWQLVLHIEHAAFFPSELWLPVRPVPLLLLLQQLLPLKIFCFSPVAIASDDGYVDLFNGCMDHGWWVEP